MVCLCAEGCLLCNALVGCGNKHSAVFFYVGKVHFIKIADLAHIQHIYTLGASRVCVPEQGIKGHGTVVGRPQQDIPPACRGIGVCCIGRLQAPRAVKADTGRCEFVFNRAETDAQCRVLVRRVIDSFLCFRSGFRKVPRHSAIFWINHTCDG